MQDWCYMAVARNDGRPYRQKVRAERQADTRRRIVDAGVALHLERGPAQTSINAIAERAGVNRVTVYRHFPDARTLLEPWRRIEDPRERIDVALPQLYDYFRRTEAGWANLLRDAEVEPLVKEMVEKRRLAHLRDARGVLLEGWPAPRTRQP